MAIASNLHVLLYESRLHGTNLHDRPGSGKICALWEIKRCRVGNAQVFCPIGYHRFWGWYLLRGKVCEWIIRVVPCDLQKILCLSFIYHFPWATEKCLGCMFGVFLIGMEIPPPPAAPCWRPDTFWKMITDCRASESPGELGALTL